MSWLSASWSWLICKCVQFRNVNTPPPPPHLNDETNVYHKQVPGHQIQVASCWCWWWWHESHSGYYQFQDALNDLTDSIIIRGLLSLYKPLNQPSSPHFSKQLRNYLSASFCFVFSLRMKTVRKHSADAKMPYSINSDEELIIYIVFISTYISVGHFFSLFPDITH